MAENSTHAQTVDTRLFLPEPEGGLGHGVEVVSRARRTFEEGRERLVTVVDFLCAIAECCDYQSDCSSHVTI